MCIEFVLAYKHASLICTLLMESYIRVRSPYSSSMSHVSKSSTLSWLIPLAHSRTGLQPGVVNFDLMPKPFPTSPQTI